MKINILRSTAAPDGYLDNLESTVASASLQLGRVLIARSGQDVRLADVNPDLDRDVQYFDLKKDFRAALCDAPEGYFFVDCGAGFHPEASLSKVLLAGIAEGAGLIAGDAANDFAPTGFWGYPNGGVLGKNASPCPDFGRHWCLRQMVFSRDLLLKLISTPDLLSPSDSINALFCITALKFSDHTINHSGPLQAGLTNSSSPSLASFANQLNAVSKGTAWDAVERKAIALCSLLALSSQFRPCLIEAIKTNSEPYKNIRSIITEISAERGSLLEESNMIDVDACPVIVEGWLDMFSALLVQGERHLTKRMLQGKWLSLPELMAVACKSPNIERTAAHYLSFNRSRQNALQSPIASPFIGQHVKRVVLHIGDMKTGSSALQNFLERNRFKLAAAGFLYPVGGAIREQGIRRIRNAGHARIFNALLNGLPRYQEFCAQVINEITATKVETVILSSENILTPKFWRNGKGFAAIIAALRASEISVVWVERPTDDLLEKSYLDRVANPMNGYTSSFSEFVEEYRDAGLLDRDLVQSIICDTVGRDAFQMASYDDVCAKGGILPWFSKAIGLDVSGFDPVAEIYSNRSLSRNQVEEIRKLKLTHGSARRELEVGFSEVIQDKNL